jgi:hypothetical protein
MSIGELEVGGGHLEQARGGRLAFLDDFFRRSQKGTALSERGARADGAVSAQRRAVGIACAKLYTRGLHAQLFGHDLGKHRLMPLAV